MAPGRYRKEGQVQTMAAATAEERRILTNLAQYGEPHEPKPEAMVVAHKDEPAVPSFSEAVELFRRTTAITDLKPSSRAGYDEVFRTRLNPRLGDMPIDRIKLE